MSTLGSKCRDCGKALRPSRQSVRRYPGTVPLAGLGRCLGCYTTKRAEIGHHKPKVRHEPEPLTAHDRFNIMTLNCYLADRRRRGAHPAGVRMEGEAA